ncbi:MAG: hypothetical protein LPK07_14430 [Hymenobacteraceae bacterium]|nr:hypothetical protein [Hymenobacteraceae bacterium]
MKTASELPALVKVLLYLTAITFVFSWLPFVRCLFDGETYTWGTGYFGRSFSGSGTAGDYWLLILRVAFGLLIFYTAYRSGKRVLFYMLLLLWYLPLLLDAVYLAIYNPEQMRFRGDTLGIDISVAAVIPAFLSLVFVLITYSMYLEQKRIRFVVPTWVRRNNFWLILLMGMLPVQCALLHFGEPHGTTDKVGVVLTILQCLLLPKVFQPYAPKPSSGANLSGRMVINAG